MIRSRLGLAVLAGICALLAIVLAIDARRRGTVADHALISGFDPDRVTRLEWTRDGGVFAVERSGTGWAVAHGQARADAGAIGDVLATLRGARWHRRSPAPRDAMARVGSRLLVTRGGDQTEIGIAGGLEGTDQRWLVIDGHALLVDGWVARALDPEPMSLREKSPFAQAETAKRIVIERGGRTIELRGTALYFEDKLVAWVEPKLVKELVDALAANTYFSAAAGPAQTDTTIRLDGTTVSVGGMCPGTPGGFTYVHADIGDGCVPELEWRRALASIDLMFRGDLAHDPQPVPLAPKGIRWDAATVIELGPPPRLVRSTTEIAVDPARVQALVAALATSGEMVPLPGGAPRGTLEVEDVAGNQIELAIHDGDVVVRTIDHTALRLPPQAWDAIAAPADALRDPTLWIEDAATISAISLDGVLYTRGATLGEWHRDPPGKLDARAIEDLAQLLAVVRAPATTEQPAAPTHRAVITVSPPVGDSTKHVIEVDRACRARVDGNLVKLGATLCLALNRF